MELASPLRTAADGQDDQVPALARAGSDDAHCALSLRGACKRYGSHLALKPTNIEFHRGQVHILFGENGAGKSTLISMLAGASQPSEGAICVNGHEVTLRSVNEARAAGVRAVFQEFSLVPHLSVADNIVLGEEPTLHLGLLDRASARAQSATLVAKLGFDLEIDARVSDLARGKQQMVEICKAVHHLPRVLILDEPTASLSTHDTQALFAILRKLREQGTLIIYITHRMEEIPLIGDLVTVLRDGVVIATVPANTPETELIQLMTGRRVDELYPPVRTTPGPVLLELAHLSTNDGAVTDVSLQLRAGEILGIAGLVGCGKSELGQACFGLIGGAAGEIRIGGRAVQFRHPADAIAQRIWYAPADRKRDGLTLIRSARENMALSALSFGEVRGRMLRPKAEQAMTRHLSSRVGLPEHRLGETVGAFSGGNQQKVMLAKGLGQPIDVYIFDEPTVGVDVGARQAIYQYLSELSAAGAAILLISSDLPELLGMSTRLLVMRGGALVAEFAREEYDQHLILEHFFE